MLVIFISIFNTAAYFYDNLMNSIVLMVGIVLKVFNHANNNKIMLIFFRKEGRGIFGFWRGNSGKEREQIVLFVGIQRLFSK